MKHLIKTPYSSLQGSKHVVKLNFFQCLLISTTSLLSVPGELKSLCTDSMYSSVLLYL